MIKRTHKQAPLSATLALNFDFDGELPQWLPLIPAGSFVGRDGRSWRNDTPDAVIARFNAKARDLVWDINHASEIKAPKGEEAPAYAFTRELQNRDGVIWGKVEWNPDGTDLITGRKYRYYSPAFLFDENNQVIELSSVGLTNKHNLFELPALNQETDETEQDVMPLAAAIALALGLNQETATEDDGVAAIAKLKGDLSTALNSEQTPDLNKFVPRADYDHQKQLAMNAETKLANYEKDNLQNEAKDLVDKAIADGKVAPASRDYYLGCCSDQTGIDNFKQFIATAPAVVADTDLDNKDVPNSHTALNAEEKEAAELLGMSVDEYQVAKKL